MKIALEVNKKQLKVIIQGLRYYWGMGVREGRPSPLSPAEFKELLERLRFELEASMGDEIAQEEKDTSLSLMVGKLFIGTEKFFSDSKREVELLSKKAINYATRSEK